LHHLLKRAGETKASGDVALAKKQTNAVLQQQKTQTSASVVVSLIEDVQKLIQESTNDAVHPEHQSKIDELMNVCLAQLKHANANDVLVKIPTSTIELLAYAMTMTRYKTEVVPEVVVFAKRFLTQPAIANATTEVQLYDQYRIKICTLRTFLLLLLPFLAKNKNHTDYTTLEQLLNKIYSIIPGVSGQDSLLQKIRELKPLDVRSNQSRLKAKIKLNERISAQDDMKIKSFLLHYGINETTSTRNATEQHGRLVTILQNIKCETGKTQTKKMFNKYLTHLSLVLLSIYYLLFTI
jgi:hypothetical protein